MKNTIIINVDSDKEQSVNISKPESIPPPETRDETKKMLDDDIACVCEALCTLIHTSDQSGYTDKESLVKASIVHLNNLLK